MTDLTPDPREERLPVWVRAKLNGMRLALRDAEDMRASELREYDVVYLTPGESWVVTSDAQTEGAVAEFSARTKAGGDWSADLTFRLPAAFHVGIVHAWRTVEARCLLCKGTYPHRMDVAVASDPRGVCGSCDMWTTARVLTDDGT